MDEQGVRINKYLSEAGVCSRREADRQIEAGAVTVDGVCARPGTRVLPGQTVCFQGRSVSRRKNASCSRFTSRRELSAQRKNARKTM